VPYIGPVIAAALPVIVALAVDPGWAMLLWAMALFVVVELAIGQVIEPWLYGHSTGLSGIAIARAAAPKTTAETNSRAIPMPIPLAPYPARQEFGLVGTI
jgi:hypothetical protein